MRQPYQQRMIKEQTELSIKLGKLRVLNRSEMFRSLPTDEQLRMQMQENAMMLYLYLLNTSINAFPLSTDPQNVFNRGD